MVTHYTVETRQENGLGRVVGTGLRGGGGETEEIHETKKKPKSR